MRITYTLPVLKTWNFGEFKVYLCNATDENCTKKMKTSWSSQKFFSKIPTVPSNIFKLKKHITESWWHVIKSEKIFRCATNYRIISQRLIARINRIRVQRMKLISFWEVEKRVCKWSCSNSLVYFFPKRIYASQISIFKSTSIFWN